MNYMYLKHIVLCEATKIKNPKYKNKFRLTNLIDKMKVRK